MGLMMIVRRFLGGRGRGCGLTMLVTSFSSGRREDFSRALESL